MAGVRAGLLPGARRRAGVGAPRRRGRPAHPYRRLYRVDRAVVVQRGLRHAHQRGQRRLGRGDPGLPVRRRHGGRHLFPQFQRAAPDRADDLREPGALHYPALVHRRAQPVDRQRAIAALPGQHDGGGVPLQSHAGGDHAGRARQRPAGAVRRADRADESLRPGLRAGARRGGDAPRRKRVRPAVPGPGWFQVGQ
ncbi:Uncharacterised protein [Bordetella pertussis]|nr:Uncharacterised protein [Bordetella pertussis]